MAEAQTKKATGTALSKSIDVLETVLNQSVPIGLPDLTAQLGYPRQSIHRILVQMEALGLIQRDTHRDRFIIGPRMTRLALNSINSSSQKLPIKAVLERLMEETDQSCGLGMFDDYQVVYIERVESKLPIRLELKVGSHVPLHCTAIGKLLFAHLPSRKRQHLFSVGPLERYTPNTITDQKELEASFKQIRKQNYSANNQEFALGIVAVGVPVRDEKGQVVAGVAIQGAESRLNIESCLKMLPALNRSAEKLSNLWKLASEPGDDDAA